MRKTTAFILICILFMLSAGFARAAANDTVTVAYIDYDNFIVKTEGGCAGYGADYLNRVAQYTGWSYEYVDMDWPAAYEAVKAGTVDFYCVARQTEERQTDFDFSLYPICSEEMNLYTMPESEIYYEDYQAFNGLRVGMLEKSDEINYFEQYANDNGFTYTLVEYPMNEDAVAALRNGVVDAIALVNYSVAGSFKLVGNFGVSPAYLMSREDSPLMAEFSKAQEKLYFDDPGFSQALEKTYYAEANQYSDILLTRGEADYIASAETLTVALSVDMAPVEYYDESAGEFKGVTVDIYNKIAELSGLSFRFIRRDDAQTLTAQMEKGATQLVGALARSEQVASELHLAQTKAFSENTFMLVTKDLSKLSADSIAAVPAGYPQFIAAARRDGYTHIVSYPTFEECVNAVFEGKARLTYIIGMCEGYLLDHARYADLRAFPCLDMDYGICLGVYDGCDAKLVSILNKCLDAMPDAEINSLIVSNTAEAKPKETLSDILAKNGLPIFIIAAAFIALVAFAVVRSEKARHQKALNVKLQKHHDFLQHLYDTLPCGVIQYGLAAPHTILGCNAACIKIYGFPDERSIVGKTPDAVVEEGSQNDFLEKFALCEKAAGPVMYIWPITRLDGSLGHTECVMDIVDTEDGKVFQEVFIDVTEARHAQLLTDALAAAEKADVAKSQFLSRVSHEMRTPLNAIIGFIELAKDADAEKTANYLASSDIAAKQLLAVINDVLDMSSIESGKMKIANASFNFRHVISAITNIYGAQCRQKGVVFETRISTPIDDWLVGDELRVNQILMNLLGNAVKFTSDGYIRLTIAETAKNGDTVFLRFTVSDTGVGMSDEMLSRIFKPFEQENATTAKQFGGSGLGLSIVKNLVNMMDGSISVSSKLGEGTTFTVDLHFQESDVGQGVLMPKTIEALRILAVDDEASEREYMGLVLDRMSVRHTCVSSGAEAIACLQKSEDENDIYNVCLVDWRMPDMNGYDTTVNIRKKYGKDVVVIVVSAYDFQETGDTAKDAGANLFLSKPIFQSSLFDLFMTMTGGKIAKPKEDMQSWNFAGKRVLLAEDNALNQIVAKGYLVKYNVVADLAENGLKAVQMFTSSPQGYYDAILMDIQMPVMDGYEAAKAIRASEHPEAKTVPIIAQTADAFNEDITRARSAGMDAHVAKPIKPDVLAKALRKAFTGQKGGTQND